MPFHKQIKTWRTWKNQLQNTHIVYNLLKPWKFSLSISSTCVLRDVMAQEWIPRIIENQSSAHASNLTSNKFWLFPAIVEKSLLARKGSPATIELYMKKMGLGHLQVSILSKSPQLWTWGENKIWESATRLKTYSSENVQRTDNLCANNEKKLFMKKKM